MGLVIASPSQNSGNWEATGVGFLGSRDPLRSSARPHTCPQPALIAPYQSCLGLSQTPVNL